MKCMDRHMSQSPSFFPSLNNKFLIKCLLNILHIAKLCEGQTSGIYTHYSKVQERERQEGTMVFNYSPEIRQYGFVYSLRGVGLSQAMGSTFLTHHFYIQETRVVIYQPFLSPWRINTVYYCWQIHEFTGMDHYKTGNKNSSFQATSRLMKHTSWICWIRE